MQPYGNKKTRTYPRHMDKPSCKCCNGRYAKIGRKWRHKCRPAKKQARQEGKSEIRKGLI